MALGQTLLQEFKIESASVSRRNEIAGLMNKGPCLITVEFEVSGSIHPVIIDTGATVSFVPENGTILKSAQHKILPANLNVILADDSSTLIDKKVILPIRPRGLREKPKMFPFYIHNNCDKVLGHAALLGLDHLKSFNLRIYVEKGKFKVYCDQNCIGQENETSLDYKAFVKIDTRVENLHVDGLLEPILRKFKGVFTDIGPDPIRGQPMRITTVHQRPIFSKQRNYDPTEIISIKEHIQELLKKGIIEPTSSGYAATSRMVPKKSGASRLVVNYIPLNKVTVRNSYCLPQIADIFAVIQGSKYFSALDCAQGFYQILVDKRDRHKTAFSSPVGNFQFVRCPFGARNSPAIFQAEMNRIFADGLYSKCIIYVDDILVFGKSMDEHNDNLRWVLERAQQYNVKIKLEKCVFAKQEVDYLGFTITGSFIKPLEDRCDTLALLEPPKDRTELRSIIGRLNFYSRFIPTYSKRLQPIRELLQTNKRFCWMPYHQKALHSIIESLNSVEPQRLAAQSEHKFIEIIALQDSVEVMCPDQQDNLISRASRFLSPTEASYSSIEKQLLALVLGLNKFRIWLHPDKFTIRTPCRDLEKTINLVHRPPRVENWLIPEGFDAFRFETKESLPNTMAKSMPEHVPEEVYYVDGACMANGKPECRASRAVCAEFDRDIEQTGLVGEAPSNNTAELTAALKACELALSRKQKNITIVTDSKYLFSAATSWIDAWSKGEWLNHKKRPIINEKLFKELKSMKEALNIQWVHVKGHGTHPGNIRADNLAGSALNRKTEILCAATTTGRRLQTANDEVEALKRSIEQGDVNNLVVEDNMVFYLDKNLENDDQKRMFVPKDSREWLLRLAHDDIINGGHSGIKKTFRKLMQFWWPGMYKDVDTYVRSCDTCQRFKDHGGLPPGYMQSIPVSKVFEHVHVDMMGPVQRTDRGNAYIITATDAFSKWAFARPCHNIQTGEVIKFMEDYILSIYGRPQTIITDRGAQFTSNDWKLWVKRHGMTHNLTTPRHPQSNGIDEQVNGTLSRILRNYVDYYQTNWDEQLKWSVFAYNTTVHESTGYSPYQVMHGLDPRSPLKNNETGDELDMEALDKARRTIRDAADANNKLAQMKQKSNYDKTHSRASLTVGQLVLVRELFIPTEFSKKFHTKWDGPYVIVKIMGKRDNPKAVTIWDGAKWKAKSYSINDIKPYLERNPEARSDQSSEGAIGVHRKQPDQNSLPENINLMDFSDHRPTKSGYSQELVESMQEPTGQITLFEGRDQEPHCPLTSSPRRVTISDQPTIHIIPDLSSIWPAVNRPAEVDRPDPSQQDCFHDLDSALDADTMHLRRNDHSDEMRIDLYNSVRDPLYLPSLEDTGTSAEAEKEHDSDSYRSIEGTRDQSTSSESSPIVHITFDNPHADPTYKPSGQTVRSSRSKNTETRNLTDSPMPQQRYGLRPTARRIATWDKTKTLSDRKHESDGEQENDRLNDISDENCSRPALTSDSDTDNEDTLIQL